MNEIILEFSIINGIFILKEAHLLNMTIYRTKRFTKKVEFGLGRLVEFWDTILNRISSRGFLLTGCVLSAIIVNEAAQRVKLSNETFTKDRI